MEDFMNSLKRALPDRGALPPPIKPGTSGECIQDDMLTQGDPKGLKCCSQNGTHGTWRTGFFCMSKQGLTATSTYMGFPVWFWVVALVVMLTIVLTKILSR
jgi:hypothetical protein